MYICLPIMFLEVEMEIICLSLIAVYNTWCVTSFPDGTHLCHWEPDAALLTLESNLL